MMKDAPLREGILLLSGLAVLAWPLSLATGRPQTPASRTVSTQSEEGEWVTDVSITSAHPFDWVELRRGEQMLGRVEGPEVEGEFEFLLAKEGEVLLIAASYPEGTPLTALQLQLWPGSFPEVNLTLWSEGEIFEEIEVSLDE